MKFTLRIAILAVLGGLWLYGLLHLNELRFQLDFEAYFPKNDQAFIRFQEFKKKFGPDDDFLLIAFERSEGVFDSSFLHQYHSFAEASKELPFIEESTSLTNLRYPVQMPLMLRYEHYLRHDRPDKYIQSMGRIFNNQLLVGNLISADTSTLVVSMRTQDELTVEQSEYLMASVVDLANNYDLLEKYHILGKPFIQTSLTQMKKRELVVSLSICTVLMIFIIWLLYRRWWPVTITLLGLGLCMSVFLGGLALFNAGGDELIALYPVIIIIVGVSDIIHILSKYLEELESGFSKVQALQVTFKEIGVATLITSLTTAAGFLSLLVTDVDMVKIFGVNSAVGVVLSYVLLMLFLAAVLPFFDQSHLLKNSQKSKRIWYPVLNWTYHTVRNKPKSIIAYTILISLVSIVGISLISTNHKFIFNLPKRSAVAADFAFFEEKLNGFRPLELVITSNSEKVIDFEFVQKLDSIENHLVRSPHVAIYQSLPSLHKSIGQGIHGGAPDVYSFPDSRRDFDKSARYVRAQSNRVRLIDDSLETTYINAIVKDVGADSVQHIIQRVSEFIRDQFSNDLNFYFTGTGLLIDKNIEYVRQSVIEGLLVAIGVVALLLGIIFRNVKMVLVGIIPNLFPLLFTAAVIGFLDIKLEISVGIVFVIAFGIAVDDTIHFLTKYKICRKHLSVNESLKTTILETGKAIVITSIILFFAFGSLVFSVFPPTMVIGTLVSLTLFSAVLSNMLLLPVILSFVDRDEESPK